MFQNIIIGQYVAKHSVIHDLDPRSKLTAIFLYVMVVFLANNFYSYALLFLLVGITILLSKVPLYFLYKGMRPIFFIVFFMFILHGLMTKDGDLLFALGPLEVYTGGLLQGLFISLRLLLLIMMTSLLTLTTTPIQLTDGLESMFSPLKRVQIPVHEIALMMSISLRFIPTLLQETEKIMKAQMARGANFYEGSLIKRGKAMVPLLVPLFIQSFRRAEDLAIAMEARSYRGGEGRTKLRELKWKSSDSISVIVVLLVGFFVFIIRV